MEVPEQSGPCYISNTNESTPKEHTTFGSLATGAYFRLLENIYIEDRNTFLIVLCASFIFCESFLKIYIFLCFFLISVACKENRGQPCYPEELPSDVTGSLL